MRKSHPILSGIENVRPYRLMKSEKLYAIEPPPMQIDSFLTAGSVTGITAYPGTGKTWLSFEAARAVATGTPFLGRFRAHRGGVLFVGSDSSDADYAQQWTRLTMHTGQDFEAIRFLIQSPFMFEDRDEIRKLIATHRAFEYGETDHLTGEPEGKGFSLIVFDTLSRLTRANQNDNTEMEDVFRNIRLLAEATGAAILLLHHNSKRSEFNDGSDWRGAMSQIGSLDAWVQLVHHKTKKNLIGIQFKKFRGITPEDFSYEMFVDDTKEAKLVASDEAVTVQQKMSKSPEADAIVTYVKGHPGCSCPEVTNALYDQFKMNYSAIAKFQQSVRNRLTAALVAGKLERYQLNGKSVYREPAQPDAPSPDPQP